MTRDHHSLALRAAAGLLALPLAGAALWQVAPVSAADAAEAAPVPTIRILHSNDVHCGGLTTSKDAIGYAGIAQAAADARAEAGIGNVTLVDAGDAIQGQPIGTLSSGGDLVTLMNAAGYDIAVPGNHEFDYGIPRLETIANDLADYPYVSCNIVNTQTNAALFDAYRILDYQVGDETVQVAYVGITTPTTLTSESPSIFMDEAGQTVWSFYGDDSGQALYDQVQKSVDAAEAAGAEYVIAVAHLGKDASSAVPERYTSTAVIAHTRGIDGLIDGHTHEIYNVELPNLDGEMVPVAQCGTQFQAYGTMTIMPDDTPGPDDVTSSITVAADLADPVAEDAAVAETVNQVQDNLAAELLKTVGNTDNDLAIFGPNTEGNPWWWLARMGETNLGDYVADAYRAHLNADIGLVNGGGIRAPSRVSDNGLLSIPAGPLTYGDLISVNPFANTLSLVEVDGQTILDALEYSVRSLTPAFDDATEAEGGFLQVSGISFVANVGIASPVQTDERGNYVAINGPRRVREVTVGGEPIDPASTYTLATIDYLVQGGSGYTMLKNAHYLQKDTGLDYEALLAYLQDDLDGTIGEAYADPKGAGRISFVNEPAEAPTVTVYRLYNPYLAGAHLFTTSEGEVADLTATGWVDEGARFTEYLDETAGGEPVWRLYNPANGDHFFTANESESTFLSDNGWTLESVAFYGAAEESIPVYRLYNPYETADGGLGNHLWTAHDSEMTDLKDAGWEYEGVGWYAVALAAGN